MPTIACEPHSLPLDALVAALRTEADRYRRGEPHDDSFALELFRRAASDEDPLAWEHLIAQYRGLVLASLKRHPAWADRSETDEEYWVMRVFQRFWSAVTAERLNAFAQLAAILAYLKLCAHSVLLDDARSARAASISLDASDALEACDARTDVAREVIGRLSSKVLWQTVLSETQGAQEPVIARLSWIKGMRPAEVYAARPELFESVDDVYRIKRNLLLRLRRSPRLADLLA